MKFIGILTNLLKIIMYLRNYASRLIFFAYCVVRPMTKYLSLLISSIYIDIPLLNPSACKETDIHKNYKVIIMNQEPNLTSKEISDYLDMMCKKGIILENHILYINQDFFKKIPALKPNSILDFNKTIYGIEFKLIEGLEVDFILKPKK
jgi:hypothetical protein